ncbi:UNVERIFIED_ORG: hypothetical protein M2312_001541 [Rhizobium esperanzae]|uniref:Uncharacterized protein n=1 Tax=Rhizobium etli (strain CIAT 652) TaxID=491916 RepID=B3PTQ5_RHIE6|nr:hypothetical protein RHECIAT_CH0002943 [Rhizobium etli CIAT 652]MDH6646911.1 hypothetical protein [Rhizobium esperanzae]
MPSKKSIFTPLSILFRPHQKPAFDAAGFWWRRRVPPPGPIGLLHRSFIAIAGPKAGRVDIVISFAQGKGKRHKSVISGGRKDGKMLAGDWFPQCEGLN